jgi:hypothetical protein
MFDGPSYHNPLALPKYFLTKVSPCRYKKVNEKMGYFPVGGRSGGAVSGPFSKSGGKS